MPREAADALGAHRVALVGHRGRADLCRLEWLLHFLLVRTGSATDASMVNGGRGGQFGTLRLARSRRSVASLCAVAPRLASGARTSMSILRE